MSRPTIGGYPDLPPRETLNGRGTGISYQAAFLTLGILGLICVIIFGVMLAIGQHRTSASVRGLSETITNNLKEAERQRADEHAKLESVIATMGLGWIDPASVPWAREALRLHLQPDAAADYAVVVESRRRQKLEEETKARPRRQIDGFSTWPIPPRPTPNDQLRQVP